VSFDEFGPLEIRPQPGQGWYHSDHPKRLPATYTRPHGVQHWLAFYDSFNPGQLLAASKAKSAALLSQKQYPPDLDSDKCIMAQSYRMPVYACKGICNSWN
jgi:hypothetical protein